MCSRYRCWRSSSFLILLFWCIFNFGEAASIASLLPSPWSASYEKLALDSSTSTGSLKKPGECRCSWGERRGLQPPKSLLSYGDISFMGVPLFEVILWRLLIFIGLKSGFIRMTCFSYCKLFLKVSSSATPPAAVCSWSLACWIAYTIWLGSNKCWLGPAVPFEFFLASRVRDLRKICYLSESPLLKFSVIRFFLDFSNAN